MNSTLVEVQGTLMPDGTLRLDERPNLPAGRVRVTLQSAGPPEGVIEVLRRVHAELAASGYIPPTAEQIDAELREGREGDERRMRELEQLQESCQGAKHPDSTGAP